MAGRVGVITHGGIVDPLWNFYKGAVVALGPTLKLLMNAMK